jgi:dolichol-phosphate mannosyltransferase
MMTSADRTWEVAGQTTCEGADVRVLRRMSAHGLTNALRDGIAAARYEAIVWLDCDFSHPPECIPQLLYMLGQGFDVVVNSRYTVGAGEDRAGKGGPLQLLLSRVLNWSVRFMLYPAFADYTSGFVAVRRAVLQAIPLQGDYGEYFVRFIYRALRQRYRVCELPYFAMPRRSGESRPAPTCGTMSARPQISVDRGAVALRFCEAHLMAFS